MSILTYPLGFIGGGKEFYNGVIENSVRSSDGDIAYFSRTMGTPTSQKQFTISAWIKLDSDLTTAITDRTYFDIRASGTAWVGIYFGSYAAGFYGNPNYAGASTLGSSRFRDTSAWYHFVCTFDTTQGIAIDRTKFFLNGKRLPHEFTDGGAPTQNLALTYLVSGATFLVGRYSDQGNSQDNPNYLTDVYFIDGYSLGPENFGEYKNGAWIPKAYAGPPPRIIDSSGYDNDMMHRNGDVTDYEKYYIGDSSWIASGGPHVSMTQLRVQSSAGNHLSFPAGTDYTIDFWMYPTDLGEGKAGVNHNYSATARGSDDGADYQATSDGGSLRWYPISLFYTNDSSQMYMHVGGIGNVTWTPNGTMADHVAKWNHFSLVRSDSGTRVNIYHNGVQVTNHTGAWGGTIGTAAPHGGNHYLISRNQHEGHQLNFGQHAASDTFTQQWFDEFRAVKGSALPPRFYFGSNYGDDSGVLPQRATTAHRFVDDERTTLLISGQSANNHARAVSLVDESGLHLDNVHSSNSTVDLYPTQDGVGKQFTISGPQHTTKESFIGNTSSILFDGADDRFEVAGNALSLASTSFTIDFWLKLPKHDAAGAWSIFSTSINTTSDVGFHLHGTPASNLRMSIDGKNSSSWDVANGQMLGDITGVNEWQHWSIVKTTENSNRRYYVYRDGALILTGNLDADWTTASDGLGFGAGGGSTSFNDPINSMYLDEIRIITGSTDKPQIKWTHTQTAGAGNKDAYTVSEWKTNGHEFTDDNATSLLVHGDAYGTTTNDTAGIFKDSSSANSIHHALVSGGGAHHSKAVTLKSDGTNGTSTTDDQGNTIRWCGSNSTVTFANSSSFDYGNTAIKFDGIDDITPTSVTGMTMGSGDGTISFWMYWQGAYHTDGTTYTGAPPAYIANWTASGTNAYLAIVNAAGARHGDSGYRLYISDESGTNATHYSDEFVIRNQWHHIVWTKTAATSSQWYVDGEPCGLSTGRSYGDLTVSSAFKLGEYYNTDDRFVGYIDDFRWNSGEAIPPRFYLGNQTPESGGSLTAFKYATFNGTNQYYHKAVDDWEYASTQGTILAWVKLNSPSGWGTIFSNADADGSWNSYFAFSIVTDGQLVFHAQTSQASDVFGNKSAKLISTTGSWHLVGVTLDGNNDVRLYIDGVDAGEFGGESGFDKTGKWFNDVTTNTKIAIGGLIRSGLSNPFKGSISQVGVWGGSSGATGVLTEAQIKAIYDLSRSADWTATSGVYGSPETAALNGYWSFTKTDEGASDGTTLYDQSSGSNDDMTGVGSVPAPSTAYLPPATNKRLSLGATEYSSAATTITQGFGNNHYANVHSGESTKLASSFGGFVDDEYTVLLLRGGNADGNTHFTDGGVAAGETITFPAHSYSYGKSRAAKSISATTAGPVHETTSQLGLHGSSISLPGDTQTAFNKTLDCGQHEDFNLGKTWALEFWFRLDDLDTGNNTGVCSIQNSGGGTGVDETPQNTFNVLIPSSQILAVYVSSTSAGTFDVANPVSGITALTATTWYHYVVQSEEAGGIVQFKTFLNGVNESNFTHADGLYSQDPAPRFRFGVTADSYNKYFDGLVDELRITKGIARYTPAGDLQSGIVPAGSVGYAGVTGTAIPTSPYLRPTPFVAADGGRGYFANTNMKLWLKSDTYPGSTTIIDSVGDLASQTAKTITNNSHTAANRPLLKTTGTDYALSGGSDAMFFDGTNDIIRIPDHNEFDFGLGDFTVESWFNPSSFSAAGNIISRKEDPDMLHDDGTAADGSDSEWALRVNNSAVQMDWITNGSTGSPQNIVVPTMSTGSWYHVAVQRTDNSLTMFFNGISVYTKSGTDAQHIRNYKGLDVIIGARYSVSALSQFFSGYLDEIRISKMARYTGQGLLDSAYPNPGTEFGIQTEGSTYGELDVQVTANTTYQRYNYQHTTYTHTDFDGVNDYYYRDIASYRGSDTQGTIVAWIKPEGITDDAALVYDDVIFTSTNYSAADPRTYLMFLIRGNKLQVRQASNATLTGTAIAQTAGTVLTNGTWYMVTLTSSGTAWNIYINDGAAETLTATVGTNTGDWFADSTGVSNPQTTTARPRENIAIGAMRYNNTDATNDLNFDGKIAQVGVWGGASGTTGVLTTAQIADLYAAGPTADWNAAQGGDYTTTQVGELVGYWTHGNNNLTGEIDSAITLYDASGNNLDLTGYSTQSIASETKLLIHSHEDIDGDTSIADSSPSAHVINRVVSDPQYVNTGVSRSVLGSTGISFPSSTHYLEVPDADMKHFRNRSNAGEFTILWWVKYNSNAVNIAMDYRANSQNDGGWAVYSESGEVGFDYDNAGGTGTWGTGLHSSAGATPVNTWIHGAVVQTGSAITLYKNAAVGETESTGKQMLDAAGTYRSLMIGGGYNNNGARSATTLNGHLDQVLIYSGFGMTSPQLSTFYNSGAGKTSIGTLGGLILHEEYEDGTNTANAATHLILHSNNATHHSHGSRNFYSDTANCRFTTTTGHEAAGRFTIGASGTNFTVLGAHQTGYTTGAMNNPSIRLKRGYSYIFSASSLSGHKLYFANSTASTTGTTAGGAYAADTALNNQYIGGQYGTNSTVDGTETWTVLDAGQYLGGNGTSVGQWAHMKFEVPIDAPKDLYYRCAVSGHEAMGNAAFIMEATEPAPVKVGTLPALKTSSWNDRDYAGIGTTKSVMAFNGTNYLSIPDSADFYFGTGNFSIDFWANPSSLANYNTFLGQGGTDGARWGIKMYSDGRVYFVKNGSVILTAAAGSMVQNMWSHISARRVTDTWKIYVNGNEKTYATHSPGFTDHANALYIGNAEWSEGDGNYFGFMDEIMIYKATGFDDNTAIERYQTGRAGNHHTANSSCVLHIKSDTTYGDTVFTDSSPSAHTITNVGGVFHHIDDNRTANTALYFDGSSEISLPSNDAFNFGAGDFTMELWYKPETWPDGKIFNMATGSSTGSGYIRLETNTVGEINWADQDGDSDIGGNILFGVKSTHKWAHIALVRRGSITYLLYDGVVVETGTDTTNTLTASTVVIGTSIKGYMDGIRITKGMPRYTSGMPVDRQSPHKRYDDGRSSNVSSNTWATSSTRRYYGINTHTYLQTTKHATNANTVLEINPDNAEVANDGINMYGDEGFHLEFKEVGAGDERDYNNFNTGVAGLGSDTSATREFADNKTVAYIQSRPNQSGGLAGDPNSIGSTIVVDEVTQTRLPNAQLIPPSNSGGAHRGDKFIFGVTSNTANVSIASGGTRNY